MKAEISTVGFDPDRRYLTVVQQQGRMLLDRDLDEQAEIIARREDAAMRDAAGGGVPEAGGLVVVTQAGSGSDASLAFRPEGGRVYAEGVAAEARPADPGQPFGYANQADFPSPPPAPDGPALAYVDVWERLVDTVEDPDLIDPGLNGADTCLRTRLVAQVKLSPLPDGDGTPAWRDPDRNPPIGDAVLAVALRADSAADDPCDPCAEEVQIEGEIGSRLFRLEVHEVAGSPAAPSRVVLKWSLENGAPAFPFASADERDAVPGDWRGAGFVFETTGPAEEAHQGVHLVPGATPARGALHAAFPNAPVAGHVRIRRWDGYAELAHDAAGWSLAAGSDGGVALSTSLAAGARGRVAFAGGGVTIELGVLTLTLALDGHRIIAGDYWLAVLRDAAPAAERLRLVRTDGTPVGIRHHFLGLGRLEAGAFAPLAAFDAEADANRRALSFPPLSALMAADVGFVNDCPHLYGPAVNVQQALDQLCKNADLLEALCRHNRHLHGWGVVCGLKATCAGPASSTIALSAGYALDCMGCEIIWPGDDARPEVDVQELLKAADLPAAGRYCLSLYRDPEGAARVAIEAEDDKAASDILSGTLLGAVMEHCVKAVADALAELGADGRRRLAWALHDLSWSGSETPLIVAAQHDALAAAYKALQDVVRSPTNCDLASDLPPFPELPEEIARLAAGDAFPATAAGPRLAAARRARLAVVFGTGGTIQIVEGEKAGAANSVALAAGNNQPVTSVADLAVSDDGRVIVAAVAVGADAQPDRLLVLKPDGGLAREIALRNPPVQSVAFPPGRSDAVYLGTRFLELQPLDGAASTVLNEAGPVRLLQVSRDGRELGFANPEGVARTDDHGGLRFSQAPRPEPTSLALAAPPDDPAAGRGLSTLAVAGADRQQPGQSLVQVFPPTDTGGGTAFSLGPGAPSLATGPDDAVIYLVQALSGQVSSLRWIRLPRGQAAFDPVRWLPAQVEPTAAALSDGRLLVLNRTSGSLLAFDPAVLARLDRDATDRLREILATYRRDVQTALARLVQYLVMALKDCICNELLPPCPAPCGEPPYRVPVACVTVVEGRVTDICNIGHRKQVVSWPAMMWWLSAVPLVPWLVQWIGRICCTEPASRTVPGTNAGAAAGSTTSRGATAVRTPIRLVLDAVAARPAASLMAAVQLPRALELAPTLLGQLGPALGSTIGRVLEGIGPSLAGGAAAGARIAGQPLDAAQAAAAGSGIRVAEVVDLDRAGAATPGLTEIALAPVEVKAGDAVVLYAKGGKVAYYAVKRAEPPARLDPAALGELEARLQGLESRKAVLADTAAVEARLAAVEARKTQLAEVTGLERQIAELSTSREALAGQLATLSAERESLAVDVAELGSQRESLVGQVAQLTSALTALANQRGTIAEELTRLDTRRDAIASDLKALAEQQQELLTGMRQAQPLSAAKSTLGLDDATIEKLAAAEIRTVGALAAATPSRLAETLGESGPATPRTLINRARTRISEG